MSAKQAQAAPHASPIENVTHRLLTRLSSDLQQRSLLDLQVPHHTVRSNRATPCQCQQNKLATLDTAKKPSRLGCGIASVSATCSYSKGPEMSYDDNNIFAKILRKEIPADVVHEDEHCLAFRDIQPQAPTHVLVIPKQPIAKLADATPEDRQVLGHLMWAAGEIARKEGIAEDGFRIAINNGGRANQTVFHLHVHVMGGRDFTWPPG